MAAYGGSSPVLLEALPNGRDIFNSCRDDEVELHLRTLHTVVTARAADLAPAIVTLSTTLQSDWAAIHTASESATGAKPATEQDKRLARENLQLMLFLNLLKLAEMFPRQPEKLSLDMQQHLLEAPGEDEDDETPPPRHLPRRKSAIHEICGRIRFAHHEVWINNVAQELNAMQQTVPTQFLTGVVRLIAFYYGLRAIDAVQSAVMAYQMQMTAAPEVAASFPSVWSIYLPSLIIYVALVVVTWFAAPRICGLCISSAHPAEDSKSPDISWNEAMIFLFGTLFVAWGITRIGDEIIQLMPKAGKKSPVELSVRNQIQFYLGIAMAGGGAVMCSRFASIYQWMRKRSKTP